MHASNWLSQNWILLVGICVLLFNVINGLVTGGAILTHRPYKRTEDPGLYWTAIIVSGALALAVIAGLVLGFH